MTPLSLNVAITSGSLLLKIVVAYLCAIPVLLLAAWTAGWMASTCPEEMRKGVAWILGLVLVGGSIWFFSWVLGQYYGVVAENESGRLYGEGEPSGLRDLGATVFVLLVAMVPLMAAAILGMVVWDMDPELNNIPLKERGFLCVLAIAIWATFVYFWTGLSVWGAYERLSPTIVLKTAAICLPGSLTAMIYSSILSYVPFGMCSLVQKVGILQKNRWQPIFIFALYILACQHFSVSSFAVMGKMLRRKKDRLTAAGISR